MSHHPKPSNDIADILAGTLMVSRGTALDIMRDTLATTGTQCQWRQADTISMPDTWEADCGAAWTFTDGGPKDNSMKFCPQCGHPLKQIDNAMTHKNDPYASEAETQALLAPDTRTEAERKLDEMMDELGAWEQGAEPYPLLRHIALELLKKQLAERPAQKQEPVAWAPYLSDRADGVKGHYAIARWNPRGYREVWNLRRHEWAAYSDDVLSLEEADSLLRLITIPTHKVTSPQPAQPSKPLTDEQIKDVAASCMWWVREQDILEDAIELTRAIEAAHGITKEKNT